MNQADMETEKMKMKAGKLYELTMKDGYATAAEEQKDSGTDFVKSTVVADAGDGVLDGYTYNGSETVIVIDDNALSSGNVESAKAGDTIYIVKADAE